MRLLTFTAGLAVGYVLGARAGREKYEQIVEGARKLQANPTLGQAQATITALVSAAPPVTTPRPRAVAPLKVSTPPVAVTPSTPPPAVTPLTPSPAVTAPAAVVPEVADAPPAAGTAPAPAAVAAPAAGTAPAAVTAPAAETPPVAVTPPTAVTPLKVAAVKKAAPTPKATTPAVGTGGTPGNAPKPTRRRSTAPNAVTDPPA